MMNPGRPTGSRLQRPPPARSRNRPCKSKRQLGRDTTAFVKVEGKAIGLIVFVAGDAKQKTQRKGRQGKTRQDGVRRTGLRDRLFLAKDWIARNGPVPQTKTSLY